MITEKLVTALEQMRALHECAAEDGPCEFCRAHRDARDAAFGADPPTNHKRVTTPGSVMAVCAFMRIAPKFYNDPGRGNERITILSALARDIDRAFYAYLKREREAEKPAASSNDPLREALDEYVSLPLMDAAVAAVRQVVRNEIWEGRPDPQWCIHCEAAPCCCHDCLDCGKGPEQCRCDEETE